MKLCKDCKWLERTWLMRIKLMVPGQFSRCLCPALNDDQSPSPITGKPPRPKFCSVMRDFDHRCGKEAKYFESMNNNSRPFGGHNKG